MLYMKTSQNKRYALELGGAFLAYGSLLFISNRINSIWEPTGTAKLLIALLPMLGGIAAMLAVIRAFRRLDELQRRIQLDALAFAFSGTALLTLAWGFAETSGLPLLSYFWIWPLMGTLWILGVIVFQARYR